MEATTSFALSLILFLSITTNGVSASRGISNIVNEPPAVLDSNGDELQQGQYYYLVPFITLPRLYTAAIIPGIFSFGTTWFQLETEIFTYGIRGLPVKFSPLTATEDKTIHESTELNIKFPDELSSPVFGGSSVLKVGELGFLSLGGAEGDRNSWFKIEKSGSGDGIYKLVSSFRSEVSSNVGISERNNGAKRLSLAHEPLAFVFRPISIEPYGTSKQKF